MSRVYFRLEIEQTHLIPDSVEIGVGAWSWGVTTTPRPLRGSRLRAFGVILGIPLLLLAASFALLVYVSSWLKCHYPAAFACALLNSQPMGFYAPAQIVRDAQLHGVAARAVDVNHEIETRGTVVEPSTYYSYSLDPAADVPTIVPAGAGVGKI